jgi:hypothetical protein
MLKESDNDVYRVVDTRIMDRIIQDAWRSDKDVTGILFEASTSYRILTLDNLKYIIDYERENRFYSTKSKEVFKPHYF